MANEIQIAYGVSGKTLDAIIRNTTGLVWQTTTNTFVSYTTANRANYLIPLTEQGTASGYYTATPPTGLCTAPTNFPLVIFSRTITGTPAESDLVVGGGDFGWDGTKVIGLANIITPSKYNP